MLLVVDAGNTNVKFGVFRDETLLVQWRLHMTPERSADEYAALLLPLFAQAGLSASDIAGIALASVVPAATRPCSAWDARRSARTRCTSPDTPTSASPLPMTLRTASARTG